MKNVLIIYTGGTIGMTRTENGYAPQSGQFRRAMEAIPDLYAEQMPRWDMLEMDPLLDSSNMTVHEWNKIAQRVADHYDAYDGFVVLHGTDTMAYTASALSFMLEGLAKPVILTGSQIPMCEIRSDGRDNLITSLLIAGAGEVHEVCLYFGGKLLRGNRATKFSADGLSAFLSPNYPSLADAGSTIRYNESALLPKPKGALKLQLLENIPIGVLKVFPGIQFSLFEQIMTERLRGIVIETFGAGNIPGDGGALLPIIEKAFHNGTVLTVCSQCPQGAVALGAYETSNALKSAGAVSGHAPPPAAALSPPPHPRRNNGAVAHASVSRSAASAIGVSTSRSSSGEISKSVSASSWRRMTALPPWSPSSAVSSGKKRAGKMHGLPRTPPCPIATMRSGCRRKNSTSARTLSRRSSGGAAT